MTGASHYPELEGIAAGLGVEVLEDAEEQAGMALSEIDELRKQVKNLRAINDGLLEQLARATGRD